MCDMSGKTIKCLDSMFCIELDIIFTQSIYRDFEKLTSSAFVLQEEYEDQDKLGRLSCRHDFHVSCIKNWLLIKDACPICKAPASSDTSKEKQKRVPI